MAGESLYFAYYNGSKRSCSVDLKRKEGLAVFRDLVVRSDVLIDNLRLGALERLGLGETRLRRLNPGLVHSSVSGFGRVKSLGGSPPTMR